MNRRLLLALCVVAGIAAAQSKDRPPDPAEFNGFDVRGALVPIDAIQRGGPPRDGIPAIDRPRFVPAARAGLKAEDRVLGLAYKGTARAYPVRILNWHEAVNDRIAGDALLVTYCPLCGTGMAFRAAVQPPRGAARELSSASRACCSTATCCCMTARRNRSGRNCASRPSPAP